MQSTVRLSAAKNLIDAKFFLVKEAGRSPPPFPFIFFKPVTCIIDHNADVIIPKICQDDQADYEGELVSSLLHIRIYSRRLTLDIVYRHGS
jgi:hypothetical protein